MTYSLRLHNLKGISLSYFLATVCILLLSGCGSQSTPQEVHRVGIISGVDAFAAAGEGLIAEMAEFGYIEGENITYDFQKINGDPAQEKEVVEKWVTDDVDLIFSFPTSSSLAAKAATIGTDIPVVFAITTLEGNDLIESVREPGGNITGVRFPGPDLTVKRLEFLLDIVPQAKRILLLHNPNYTASVSALAELEIAAEVLAVELVVKQIIEIDSIKIALQNLEEDNDIGVDAILIMPEVVVQSPAGWQLVSTFATKHHLPIGGSADFTMKNGAIFSYIPDSFETGKLAAPLVVKVLNGTRAGTIPVLTPESRLRINYARAEELGLTVPEGLLSQATDIIR